jgi:C-terminal processing protease CtpA/Prc
MKLNLKLLSVLAILPVLLAACGGGSSAPAVTPPAVDPPVVVPPVTPEPPATPDWLALLGRCEHPRQGLGPNGLPYYDSQGTLSDELKWLRSFIDETYLWYKEVPTDLVMADYSNPLDYFAVLKTPAITASGRAKDRFHFTYPTEVWNEMSSAGVELTYGITWSRSATGVLPRLWVVTLVEPGSPAALAGLRRGDTLLSVDGVDFQATDAADVAILNAGLAPEAAGDRHQLVLSRSGARLPVTLTAARLALAPVQDVKLLATATGSVGYLQFHDHNGVAEWQLAEAFQRFQDAGVADLVLDMRYNGGGYLRVASELAYMIAGPQATTGKIFEQLHRNDKLAMPAADPFSATALGFVPAKLKAGAQLPALGLKRVTILTTAGTCSASESVINSLRGIDVEVNLIGGETCGKPYAFTPAPNCGTTYFAIQLQGVNNKGFGDYADGFQPTCKVADDLTREVGDTSEGMLAAALSYRANGVCPVSPLRNRTPSGPLELVRPEGKQIAIRQR